ncbi:MAG: type III-B CRISPR module RAMP protein Cmr6 [Enhydrobacter sp.]|nr:MAG: type III-B CRISPR module RAMP protein Cmr6 [Enhydrobacter sp.]
MTPNAPLPQFRPESLWATPGQGNLGLWYDKYYHRWPAFSRLLDFNAPRSDAEKTARLEWVKQAVQTSRSTHLADQLSEHAIRQRELAGNLGGQWFEACTATKFASGLGRAHPVENGFDWHYTLGVPVLRGAGQKGIVREWAKRWLEQDPVPLLGGEERAGAVAFLPALPSTAPELCIDGTTPHLGEYYQEGQRPADWYDPRPLQWLAVAKGSLFQFAVVPLKRNDEGKRLAALACEWLKEALSTLGAGAGTAVDRGLFEIVEPIR